MRRRREQPKNGVAPQIRGAGEGKPLPSCTRADKRPSTRLTAEVEAFQLAAVQVTKQSKWRRPRKVYTTPVGHPHQFRLSNCSLDTAPLAPDYRVNRQAGPSDDLSRVDKPTMCDQASIRKNPNQQYACIISFLHFIYVLLPSCALAQRLTLDRWPRRNITFTQHETGFL